MSFTLALARESPTPDVALSFQDALKTILERSQELEVSRQKLRAQESRALPSKLHMLPDLKMTTSIGAASKVESNLNLFRFGADQAEKRSQDALVEQARASLDTETLQAEDDAISTLLLWISASNKLAVLERFASSKQHYAEIADQRFQRGLIARQEKEKLEIDLENQRSRLVDAKVSFISASARLEEKLGHTKVAKNWPWINQWSGTPKLELDVSRVPSVRSAMAFAQAQDEVRVQRERQLFPSLDAGFDYIYSGGLFGSASGETGWTATLTLSIPLFQRLTSLSEMQAQSADFAAAEAEETLARRNALSEYQSAKNSFSVQLSGALARQKTLGVAKNLFNDARKRFELGRASANDLAIDEARLIETELNLNTAWQDAHLSWTDYCHSVGLLAGSCF